MASSISRASAHTSGGHGPYLRSPRWLAVSRPDRWLHDASSPACLRQSVGADFPASSFTESLREPTVRFPSICLATSSHLNVTRWTTSITSMLPVSEPSPAGSLRATPDLMRHHRPRDAVSRHQWGSSKHCSVRHASMSILLTHSSPA